MLEKHQTDIAELRTETEQEIVRLNSDRMKCTSPDEMKQIDEQIAHIQKMNFDELLCSPYIGENRAPIIVAATVIFKQIYDDLQIKTLTASLKGAQEAMIKELAEKWQS